MIISGIWLFLKFEFKYLTFFIGDITELLNITSVVLRRLFGSN